MKYNITCLNVMNVEKTKSVWQVAVSDTDEQKDQVKIWRWIWAFSIKFHIKWKFCFAVTLNLIAWSLQFFVHDATAVLSWDVQKFVVI